MSYNTIDNNSFDWKPTKKMVGRIVRFGNGAIGIVVRHSPFARSEHQKEDVRVIQFMNPEGIIEFQFIERLGFAEDYDMCYDYEADSTEPEVGRLMRMLNEQVDNGDKFRLFQELFKAMSHGTRQRQDEEVWADFRKIFPAYKRHP